LAKRKRLGEGLGEDIGTDLGKDLARLESEWIKLPGRSERYKRGSKVISRRQYENLKAKLVGWRSWSEYQREARTDDWIRFRGIAAFSAGKKPKAYAGLTSDFAQRMLGVKRAREDDASNTYDPDGPLAELLVFLGLRKPDAEWNVGDTP
jgi:hypothetical protein